VIQDRIEGGDGAMFNCGDSAVLNSVPSLLTASFLLLSECNYCLFIVVDVRCAFPCSYHRPLFHQRNFCFEKESELRCSSLFSPSFYYFVFLGPNFVVVAMSFC